MVGRWRGALAGIVVLAAGCGGADAVAPRPEEPRAVRFEASDGRRLHGRLTPADEPGAPAVVLVHGLYGEPAQWNDFAGELQREGYATLAYASRSDHEPDPAVLARDVIGAVRFLRERPEADPDRIVVVGSSVGGAAVVLALGTRPGLPVRGGVALSPVSIDVPRGGRLHPRGLLLMSDTREAATARGVRRLAPGAEVFVAETTAHGVDLLANPPARARAVGWLERLTATARAAGR